MPNRIKAIPHILLLRRSTSRSSVQMDMLKWLKVYDFDHSNKSMNESLTWLLDAYPEFRNLFYHRIGRYSSIAGKLLVFLAKKTYPPVRTFWFIEPMEIGPGFFVRAGFGTLVGAEKIGKNCWVNSSVVIGYKDHLGGYPTIGDNVYIGAGAKVLGPITIGDNVVIGANSVVVKSVPSNCTVAGVPAQIIKRDGIRVNESLPASIPTIQA